MSDDGREVDVDSGEEEGEENVRAHHAALERHRRDQIKDAFFRLSEAVPTMSVGDKRARYNARKARRSRPPARYDLA